MLLNRQTDYTIRLLMYLALHGDRSVTISEASRQFGVPRNNMMKICRALVHHGYVRSVRGKGGGVGLAVPAEDINLREIAVRTEATFEIIECQRPRCPIAGSCVLKKALMRARDAFLQILGGYTIADLVAKKSSLLKLLDSNAA